MQAVQAVAFGDPNVLTVAELPDPTPGPGEVSIDVSHAAVGLIDLFFRQGLYKDQVGMPQPPFVPGLEVAGTVRALGEGVTHLSVGEPVVAMSQTGTGGYASVYVAPVLLVASTAAYGIDPALAVAMVPNAAMAHVALTQVAHLTAGETALVHGALGGFSAGFPGMARSLGANRVVGTVRASKLDAAVRTKLPYDTVVDSAELPGNLGEERFDVVIDPVGGATRTHTFPLMRPGSRLIASGNASNDWEHTVQTSQLWLQSIAIAGFNAGAFLPAHPETVQPALEAALKVVADGGAETAVDVLTFGQATEAHERMENRSLDGRIVLTPGA